MSGAPNLLVTWEPRWRRTVAQLAGSYALHAFALIVLASWPAAQVRRALTTVDMSKFNPEQYEVIYLPTRALPPMNDAGGAATGFSGRGGGTSVRTPEQVIRITRGNAVTAQISDAPRVLLPHNDMPANLLATAPVLPPIPASAMTRNTHSPTPTVVIASAVAPSPVVTRDRIPAVPAASIAAVPPPVSAVVRDNSPAPKLELPTPVAPAVDIQRTEAAALDALRQGIVPPDVKVVNIGSIARESSAIISPDPGTAVAKPVATTSGSIAMSPTGNGKPGLGDGVGTGAGDGISTGAASGLGAGSGETGTAHGNARTASGISPTAGPGGSGTASAAAVVAGVTISGGQVFLPSFGATATPAMKSARTPAEKRNAPAVTVVATARSGGAIIPKGLLKGAKVYTVYLDTAAGLAFLQFAERAANNFQHDLTAPELLSSVVPPEMRSARVMLAGVMDRNGSLRDLRVLQAISTDIAQRLIAAVQQWHFRPALQSGNPVEVDAIFGLNIDTR
jgi:hypothetical protein